MLKKVVDKFRKPKFANLSNEEKVKHFSDKAIGLFDHMKKAHDELEGINNELLLIATSESKKAEQELERHQLEIKKISDNMVRAQDEIDMNKKFQEKLAEFIR